MGAVAPVAMLPWALLAARAAECPLYATWNLASVQCLGDAAWHRLPTISRADLRRLGTAACGGREGREGEVAFFTSGTTDMPAMVRYGASDLERVAELCARLGRLEGITPQARVMVLLPAGLWTVGKLTTLGHLRLGADVFPVDLHGGPDLWNRLVAEIEPTVISSTPSVLSAWAPQYQGPQVAIVETTGETLLASERARIEAAFGGRVYDAYGLSECVVGAECAQRNGFHFWPDSVHVDILLEGDVTPSPPGKSGEIVLTSLMQTALPVLRYRTGDRGYLAEACACGSPAPRIMVQGRVDASIPLPRGIKLSLIEIERSLATLGVRAKCRFKQGEESRAARIVGVHPVPVLELSLDHCNPQRTEVIRQYLLTAFPDLAELAHEGAIQIDLFSKESVPSASDVCT